MNIYSCLVLFLIFFCFPSAAFASHNEVGKVRCLDCHVTIPLDVSALTFHDDTSLVCSRCHDAHKGEGNHPVEVKPSMEIPGDMPLDGRGYMTCITCHSFHNQWKALSENKNKLLRRENGATFCFYCHSKL